MGELVSLVCLPHLKHLRVRRQFQEPTSPIARGCGSAVVVEPRLDVLQSRNSIQLLTARYVNSSCTASSFLFLTDIAFSKESASAISSVVGGASGHCSFQAFKAWGKNVFSVVLLCWASQKLASIDSSHSLWGSVAQGFRGIICAQGMIIYTQILMQVNDVAGTGTGM